jgi:inner membrane protein
VASLGHVAIGMAAARVHDEGHRPIWRSRAAWSALSMLPDIDVIGFSFGVAYGDPWGHRGATHSFAFSLVAAVAVGLVARWRKRPALRTALLAFGVLATHPILDTMTDGGLGCALFWPFDLTRYFAPWRPIQVAPIGLAFFSRYGLLIALSELVLFFPLFAYALNSPGTRRLRGGVVLAFWLPAAWLVASTDPIREAVVAYILRDRTEYASGFSEKRFGGVAGGQSQMQVREQLGAPLEEGWMYPPEGQSPANLSASDLVGCGGVRFQNDVVSEAFAPAACESRGVRPGQPKPEVERLLGRPSDSCWDYTKGRPGRPFRLRLVCFHGATVEMIARRWEF